MATGPLVQAEYVSEEELVLQVTDIGGGKKLCIFTDDKGRDILISSASVPEDYHDTLYATVPVVSKENIVFRMYKDMYAKTKKDVQSKVGDEFEGFDWDEATSAVSNNLTFGHPTPQIVVSKDKKKTMTVYSSAMKSGRHHRLGRLFIIIH